jgi:hypothetical protein
MMMRTTVLVVGFSSVLLVSCREGKVAEQYAARMGEVLKAYRSRVEIKIQAEQQSYVDLATIYDSAEVNRIQNELDISRNRQTREFSDRIQKAAQGKPANQKTVWLSELHTSLQAYAAEDFKQGQMLLTREMDAYRKSLQDLDDLSVDEANLNKLQSQLAALAKPKSTVEQLRSLAEFGCDVNRNSRLMEIDHELTDLAKKIQAEKNADKKASLEKQKTTLETEKGQLANPCKV